MSKAGLKGKQKKKKIFSRKLRLKLAALLLLAVTLLLLKQTMPLLETAALQKAHILVSGEIVSAAREQIIAYGERCDYESLMHIERDVEGRVTLLAPDTMLLNELVADTTLSVQKNILEMEDRTMSLPAGVITGSWYLANLGPDFNFRFRIQGTPRVSLVNEFNDAGINQVQHRLLMNITCDIRITIPFFAKSEQVLSTVLLAEGIIVGYTPDTYLGFSLGN